MAVKHILVKIETEDDIDIDEYIEAINDACQDIESGAMMSADCDITIQEVER